eukprot:sb/3475293/
MYTVTKLNRLVLVLLKYIIISRFLFARPLKLPVTRITNRLSHLARTIVPRFVVISTGELDRIIADYERQNGPVPSGSKSGSPLRYVTPLSLTEIIKASKGCETGTLIVLGFQLLPYQETGFPLQVRKL